MKEIFDEAGVEHRKVSGIPKGLGDRQYEVNKWRQPNYKVVSIFELIVKVDKNLSIFAKSRCSSSDIKHHLRL